MSIYLDCNASTPIEPEVSEIIRYYTDQEYGNAGSRTHEYGSTAKQAVQKARKQVASVIQGIDSSDVIFTSGATESNNLSILGLLNWAKENSKKHIITTSLEHKAVLEPIAYAESLGFKVSCISTDESGVIDTQELLSKVRSDTFLVSVMHVNNETGIIQPITEIANGLPEKDCYFHIDAAQGFGKVTDGLDHPRINLTSISGHKIYGPKGIGALIMRRHNYKHPPITPLHFGGGQERGLRPGTLAVPLIAGLGTAAELCQKNHSQRSDANRTFHAKLFKALEGINYQLNGSESQSVPHAVNISFTGINSEALMLSLKGIVAISNGSACTSNSYKPSHVLKGMGLSEDRINSSVRISWCHMTEEPDWEMFRQAITSLK